MAASDGVNTLRAISWNVFGLSNPADIGRALREQEADVACLQEVTWFTRPPSGTRGRGLSLEVMCEAAGMPFCAAGVLPWGLGNAIVSRHPIEYASWVCLDAAVALTQEYRALVVAVVRVPPGPGSPEGCPPRRAAVACIHVDHLTEDARVLQFRQAAGALGHGAGPGPVPHVIFGDFNSVNRADYPDPLWERMEDDRRGHGPAGVRLIPSILRSPAAGPSGAGRRQDAFGYSDALAVSWAGSMEAAGAAAGAGGGGAVGAASGREALTPGVARAVTVGAGLVARARGVTPAPSTPGESAELLRRAGEAAGAGEWPAAGFWDRATRSDAMRRGNRLLRRRWLSPAAPPAPAGMPMESTCRFATRIDFGFVHQGGCASPAREAGCASGQTSRVGRSAVWAGSRSAEADAGREGGAAEAGIASEPATAAAAEGSAASAASSRASPREAAPSRVGLPPVFTPKQQPEPAEPEAVAASLRRLSPSCLAVVPGSYRVVRTIDSDHDIVRVDLSLVPGDFRKA